MDMFEKASELETKERELRVAAAMNKPTITPQLGCGDCSNISLETAKQSCDHYRNCLGDWEKIQFMKTINGGS